LNIFLGKNKTMKKLKTAVFLTGSGGTISQEVAIIDQLIKQGKLTFDEDETFLAGFGSGALTLVAINACFRKDNPCSWNDFYKDFLSSISDDEIFIKVHPTQWLTHPQRKDINLFLKIAGLNSISDLPFNSAILTSSLNEKKTLWLKSTSKKCKELEISDILMASTAIPVLFPPQQLNSIDHSSLTPYNGAYSEGATFGIFHKLKKQLKKIVAENGPFEDIIIISPNRNYDNSPIKNHDLSALSYSEKVELNNYLDQISLFGFLSFLRKIQKLNFKRKIARSIVVSYPEIKDDFELLDYSNQIPKYEAVNKWLEKNQEKLSINLETRIKELTNIPSIDEMSLRLEKNHSRYLKELV
jgi:hypothetical protein